MTQKENVQDINALLTEEIQQRYETTISKWMQIIPQSAISSDRFAKAPPPIDVQFLQEYGKGALMHP